MNRCEAFFHIGKKSSHRLQVELIIIGFHTHMHGNIYAQYVDNSSDDCKLNLNVVPHVQS